MPVGCPTSVAPAVATSPWNSSASTVNGQWAFWHASKTKASWGRFSAIGPPARPQICAGPFVSPPPGSAMDARASGPPDCDVPESPATNRTRAASGIVNPFPRSGKNSIAVTVAVLVNTLGRELVELELELPLELLPEPLVWANAAHGAKAAVKATPAPIRHVLPT